MLKPIVQLSWSDRFSILNQMTIDVTPEDICRVFQVTPEDYAVATELLDSGLIRPNPRINHEFYELFFKGETPEFPPAPTRVRVLPAPPDAELIRAQAGNPPRVPGPRGRKSNNIGMAFKAIPPDPVNVEEFAKKHRVSIAVLRQHKRFDKYPGTVFVRTNKEKGYVEIWRVPAPTEESTETSK